MTTIRIRMLDSVTSTFYAYPKGAEVDAPEEIALDLLKGGHAERISASPEKALSKQANKAEKR